MKLDNAFGKIDYSDPNLETSADLAYREHSSWINKVVHQTVIRFSLPWKFIDEYRSAANLGFMEALRTSNSNNKYIFKKYCFYRIFGSIIDFVRKNSELSPMAYRFKVRFEKSENLDHYDDVSDKNKLRLSKLLEYLKNGAIIYRVSISDVPDNLERLINNLDPESIYLTNQRLERLMSLVQALPCNERNVIEQFYFGDQSYKDISSSNKSYSKGWLSKLHKRAIGKLRNQLQSDIRNDLAA